MNNTTPAIIDSTSLVVPEKFNIENQEVNKELLRARIAEDTFKPLCTDINDTKGYKLLIAKRAEYRTLRTSLEKHRKDIVKPLQTYMTDLKESTDELGNIAYEGEQFFDDAIKSIDAEKARLKREEEERKAQALQARIADINALGAIYHDGTYTLPYDESKSVTATQIATLSDEGFEALLDEMKEAFAENETKLHEERLKEEAEKERLRGLQKQLEDLQEFNRRREEELRGQVTEYRISQLLSLGYYEDPSDSGIYIHANGNNLSEDGIWEATKDEWDFIIKNANEYVSPVAEQEIAVETTNEVPSGNPVDMPDESYMAQYGVETVPWNVNDRLVVMIGSNWSFTPSNPYSDFERSSKEIIRLYPDEFAEIALSGCKVVKQGKIQGLNIAVIKK